MTFPRTITIIVGLVLAGCARTQLPGELLGEWIDGKTGGDYEHVFLRADGTGTWLNPTARAFTWTYDPRTELVTFHFPPTKDTDGISRLKYYRAFDSLSSSYGDNMSNVRQALALYRKGGTHLH